MQFYHVIVFAFLASYSFAFSVSKYQTELLYSWNFVNFTFQNEWDAQQYIQNKAYENCMISGVKVSQTGDVFVSVPRWKNESGGVPATLSKLVFVDGQVLLQPYPSWEMNKIGDPNALQSVLGFEIDSKNVLWAVDQGKIAGKPAIPGSIKLLLFDLNTDTLIQSYVFSEDEAPLENSFLNDIVVDQFHQFAYIPGLGSNPLHAGLLVYNAAQNTARRVLNQVNSTQPDLSVKFEVNGEKIFKNAPALTGADGVALNPDASILFYCPLTSRELFSISTELLRNESVSEKVLEENVQQLMNKLTTTGGMACSNEKNNSLYITALEFSGILQMNANISDELNLVTFSNEEMIWPDSIGFDHKGWMLFTTNKLHKFIQNELSFNETNFKIWRVFIGAGSYLDSPFDFEIAD